MKKTLLVCCIFLLTMGIANALPVGVYGGVRGGISAHGQEETRNAFKMESNGSMFASVNAGVKLLDLRAEIEYIYRNAAETLKFYNAKAKDISTQSVMGNLYYNIFSLPFLRLYINGGLGHTAYNTNYINVDKNFSYSAGFGVTFSVMEIISIDAGYRYFDMGKIEINSKKSRVFSNDIYVGLRFGF